jgi:hypothetical protein
MLLKRKYDLRDPAQPVVTGVELRHTGIKPEQNFSVRLVSQGLAEGWLELGDGTITLHTDVAPLRYTVRRAPGYYCCHDGKRIPISDMAQQERLRTGIGRLAALEARAYLATQGFAGKPSPDAANPAGYQVLEHYECVLDAAQHAKWKAKPGALAPSMRAAKEG